MPPHAPSAKPRLLFLAPVVPRASGNGLAMRCHLFLCGFAGGFDVHLHVVPLADPRPEVADWPALRELTADVVLHPLPSEEPAFRQIRRQEDPRQRLAMLAAYPKPLLCRFDPCPTIARIAERCNDLTFDAVHVARLYLAPIVPPVPVRGGASLVRTLDLDDHESALHRRFAELWAHAGEQAQVDHERHEERCYARMEREWLPRFDRVFLANDADRADLARRFDRGDRFIHVPNAVPLPTTITTSPRRRAAGAPLRLLFVGTLNYFPNEDGLGFFCDQVLPLLRAGAAPRAVRLVVAGARPSSRVQAMAAIEGVVIVPDVPDLGPLYRDADVVIAPIRVGGGTRIKVLEAFAHRRPMVASSAAVEGIDVRDGEHLAIADTPAAFATACLRLSSQPRLAGALTARAHELVHASHDPADIAGRIQAVALQACRQRR